MTDPVIDPLSLLKSLADSPPDFSSCITHCADHVLNYASAAELEGHQIIDVVVSIALSVISTQLYRTEADVAEGQSALYHYLLLSNAYTAELRQHLPTFLEP